MCDRNEKTPGLIETAYAAEHARMNSARSLAGFSADCGSSPHPATQACNAKESERVPSMVRELRQQRERLRSERDLLNEKLSTLDAMLSVF